MTNGINGINGINGCFIPPIAQWRAKSPCVGADIESARGDGQRRKILREHHSEIFPGL